MNRDEAIAIIRKEYLCVDRDCDIERSCGKCDLMMPSKEPILEAYKMAIKALEQEPCDNAVSRRDVLDLAKKGVLVSNGNYKSVCKAINEISPVNPQLCEDAISRAEAVRVASGYCHPANVAKELAKLPPVTPQPKTVEWNTFELFQSGIKETWYECPKCKWSNALLIPRNYCPNCGAKMVEPQERSEKE